MDNLGYNKEDLMASAAKSIVGIVPFAGSFLSELVGNVIPNQRIDRLAKFIKELDTKILTISENKLQTLISNEDFIDLIEESIIQASRTTSDERRQYIVSIVYNGINEETIQFQESKYLLRLLQEINDIEIIWLRFYQIPTIGGDQEFRETHKNILTKVHAFIGSDDETLNKSAIQKSYIEHLERLELIKSQIQFNSKTGIPEFDKFTGRPKNSYTVTTRLGFLLLKQIGLYEENS